MEGPAQIFRFGVTMKQTEELKYSIIREDVKFAETQTDLQ